MCQAGQKTNNVFTFTKQIGIRIQYHINNKQISDKMSNSTNLNADKTVVLSTKSFEKLFLADEMRDLSITSTADASAKVSDSSVLTTNQNNSNGQTNTTVNVNQNNTQNEIIFDKCQSNASVQIHLKTLTGRVLKVTLTGQQTILDLKQAFELDSGISTSHQRLIFAGKQLQDGRKICQYGLYNEATVHVVMRLNGDIGQFVEQVTIEGKDEGSLCGDGVLLGQTGNHGCAEVSRLIESLKGNNNSRFQVYQLDTIYRSQISNLVKYLNQKYEQAKQIQANVTEINNNNQQNNSNGDEHNDDDNHNDDLKIKLTNPELVELISPQFLQTLKSMLPTYNTIILRRCQAYDKIMKFHIDKFSKKTLQVSLNSDNEYRGGKLIYATKDGFEVPVRGEGTVTVHDDEIVHGVTKMESGVRYGLFLLEK